MGDHRTHRVTTGGGILIGGTVHGRGPALVLLHGMLGDGDLDWRALLPHLTGRFTCDLPSWRGRGLSGDHPDLGFGRMVDDLLGVLSPSRGDTSGLLIRAGKGPPPRSM